MSNLKKCEREQIKQEGDVFSENMAKADFSNYNTTADDCSVERMN
jgi:hypothetical protein